LLELYFLVITNSGLWVQNYKEIDKTPFYCVRLIFAVVQKEIVVFRFVQNLFNLFKKSRDLQFPAFYILDIKS